MPKAGGGVAGVDPIQLRRKNMTKIYNRQENKTLRQKLRRQLTKGEVILWKYLKNKQMLGYSFHRQKPLYNYILDFYCPQLKLIIEVNDSEYYCKLKKINCGIF